MKQKFVKSLLCLALVGSLIVGEAATAFAAEPDMQVSVVEETQEAEAENTQEAEAWDTQEAVETEAEEMQEEAEMQGTLLDEAVEESSETESTEEEEEVSEAESEEAEASSETESAAEEAAVSEAESAAEETEASSETESAAEEATPYAEPVALPKTVKNAAAAQPPSVSALNLYSYDYNREISIYIRGYGKKFDVFVNDKLYRTLSNYDDSNDNAPYYYDDCSLYNTIPGAAYKVTVTPYDANGVKGTSMTKTVTMTMPTISSVNGNVYGSIVYDDKGNTTGYRQPYISLNAYLSNSSGNSCTFEIWRAEGKKNASYKKIGSATDSYSVGYTDRDVVAGKTYYYKIRYVSGTDEYVKTPINGNYSGIAEVSISKPEADCDVDYVEGSVMVFASNYGFSSGFDVYRSSSMNGNYKKIATTADTVYEDKSVKSGNTYYYKLKPFYYDIKKGKKYPGNLSDPAGVKLLLGSISTEIKQTGSSQVKISWEPVSGAQRYEIYYKSGLAGDAYRLLGSTASTSYTAKKLSTETNYYFQVRAYKEAGNVKSYYQSSSDSIFVGFKAPEEFYISKRSVKVTGSTATISSTLKWSRVYGATGYEILGYSNQKGTLETIKKINKGTTTSYVFKNTITPSGSKYSSVYIVAVNKKESSYQRSLSGTNVLNAVSNVKAKRKSADSVTISWKKTAGADAYYVYRKAPTGSEVNLGKVTKTSFVDKNLTPGVNYTYRIVARNEKIDISSSDSSVGKEALVTNSVVYCHKLGKGTISSVTNASAKKATVKWKSAAYAKSYIVYRADSKNGKYKKVKEVKGKTSYTDSGLKKGKTYYYKIAVEAVNDAGITITSDLSAAKSVEIKK